MARVIPGAAGLREPPLAIAFTIQVAPPAASYARHAGANKRRSRPPLARERALADPVGDVNVCAWARTGLR